jgi:hypothetical protein
LALFFGTFPLLSEFLAFISQSQPRRTCKNLQHPKYDGAVGGAQSKKRAVCVKGCSKRH